jgi:outer membrane protein TolC
MIRIFVTIALLALCSRGAAAQEPVPVALTVGDAVARALEHSQRLVEARAREEGAQAAIVSRQAAERPIIAISGGYARTNHVEEFGVPQPNGVLRVIYPDIPNNYFTRTTLQWPIYSGGRTDALIRAAEAEARATHADLDVVRADLRLEAVRTYWALVTATESVRVVEESLARADAHLRDVRSRFDNGLIPPNEVSSVEAQRARQEMQLIEARNLRSSVLVDLRRLTGITGDIVATERLALFSGVQGSNVPGFQGSTVSAFQGSKIQGRGAVAERAEQEALKQRIAAAEQRVEAVDAARKPSLSLAAAVDYANPNPRIFPRRDAWRTSWELGVTATWTLWDGGRVAADVAEASASVRALQARQADVDALIASEVRQRQLDLDSARASLGAAAAAVRSAGEARRVIGERFNVGVATSTEVLDAQVALLQAELDQTRALANIRLAEARLERARGSSQPSADPPAARER